MPARAQGGRAAGWTGCVRRGLAGTAELLARCLSDSTPQACSRTHTVEGLSSPGSPLSVPLWASGQTAAGHLPGRRICMSPTWECGLWPGRVGQSTCVSSGCRGCGSAEALLACTSEAVVTQHHGQRQGQHHGQRHGHVGGQSPRPAPWPAPACCSEGGVGQWLSLVLRPLRQKVRAPRAERRGEMLTGTAVSAGCWLLTWAEVGVVSRSCSKRKRQ